MQLRPYQNDMLNDIRMSLRENRAIVGVLPTGGGKTVIFSAMAAGAIQKGKSVWAAAHREELVFQMSDKFNEFGVHHGIIKPGIPETPSLVQAAMIQTLRNRLGRFAPPDLFIIDEGHHTPSNTYMEILQTLPQSTKIVLMTATPIRFDGKGLGLIASHMVQGPNVQELISLGYLVPPKVFRPPGVDTSKLHTRMGDYIKSEAEALMDKPTITGDAIEHWKKHANGLQSVAFCVSVAHAEHVAAEFNAAGIPAASVDGSMTKDQRKMILDLFRCGKIRILTSCDLISEGFDLPEISCAILLRPVKSLGLYLQQVGRALRPAPGKHFAIILDHVGVTKLHGRPDEVRHWSLNVGAVPREPDEDEKVWKTCSNPDCFVTYWQDVCPECGKEDEEGSNPREIETVAGELVEAVALKYPTRSDLDQLKGCNNLSEFRDACKLLEINEEQARKFIVLRAISYDDLLDCQRVLDYKRGWANHRYAARHGQEALDKEIERRRRQQMWDDREKSQNKGWVQLAREANQ